MSREGFEAEGLVARCTPNHIFIEHFGYERGRCSVAPSRLLAHLARPEKEQRDVELALHHINVIRNYAPGQYDSDDTKQDVMKKIQAAGRPLVIEMHRDLVQAVGGEGPAATQVLASMHVMTYTCIMNGSLQY